MTPSPSTHQSEKTADYLGEGSRVASDTPEDKHKRELSRWLLGWILGLFTGIIGGCAVSLVVATFRDGSPNNERILSTIQAVLTTSIGLLGGLATTVTGHYFQSQKS